MRKEVTSPLTFESEASAYAYVTVQAIEDVANAMRHVAMRQNMRFALVKMTLLFDDEEGNQLRRTAKAEQSMRYFLEDVRPLVRRTDLVFLLQNVMYFVLPGADLQGGRIVQERLWEALLWRAHNREFEILAPQGLRAGYSACSESCQDVYQCIDMAGLICRAFDFAPAASKHEEAARDGDLSALARRLGIPYLAFLPRHLSDRVWRLVSPNLARELHCYPLGHERDVLTVAMLHPQDGRVIDRLRQETGLRIFPVLTHPYELQVALEHIM